MENQEILDALKRYGTQAGAHGFVCGNSLIDTAIYDATKTVHVEADEELGIEEHDEEQQPCIADYIRSIVGDELLAVNAKFSHGNPTRVAALVDGDSLVRNYARGAWVESDVWSV